ncbi:hypothetical protein H6785_02690 [Candidatus Nomurabacteria bacterium]|nr:hypothetical protein [Candidatus Kaiserbacteria bacterium]MCB9815457.1 hypothetical protein [Candidatus Nomurabacteria bacterium]
MTNVSKKELAPEVKKKLFQQFSSLFVMAGERKMGSLFIEFFTESEQMMFVKRVGIIIMLSEEHTNYSIAKTLEVSEATVRSIKGKLIAGGYQNILKITKKNTFDSEKFWSVMGLVLRGGLPPMVGRGRWKSVLSQK